MKVWLGTLVAVMALGTTACGDDEDSTGGDTPRATTIAGLTGDTSAGNTVYTSSCADGACHGSDGTSSASTARDLNTAVPALSNDQIITIILDGSSANGGVMPALGSSLSDQQIADVVAYCRATFDP